ncbi:hypothetical protein EVG20_g9308 [Dentipellis fragilis]|uniref:F-box domain-containing protein n=1 Tax=Dentipellis fragilis TaxID=205917 RepID=A0A4Y9Y0L4_9AGAM|nr:hypothetical protein EVG20_g9308 [Dentipellis fragilis]
MEALKNLAVTSQILPLLRKGRGADGQDPDHCFTQYALVNKTWLSVSRRELYRYVHLNTSDKKRGAMHQFCETITKSPHLASLVRSINFVSGSLEAGETSDLARAIILLPNLTAVRIRGWNPDELDKLALALKSCSKLEALELSPESASKKGSTPLYTICAFFEALHSWPKLCMVFVHRSAVGSRYTGPILEDVVLEEGNTIEWVEKACPDLRRFEFHYGRRDGPTNGYLLALSKMAPSLSELYLRDGPILSGEFLRPALKTWAPHLTELRLDFHRFTFIGDFESHHLDDILTRMPALRTLLVSTRYLRLSSLAGGSFANLAAALIKPGSLPSLRRLAPAPSRSLGFFDSASFEHILDICRQRDITVCERCFHDKEMEALAEFAQQNRDDLAMFDEEEDFEDFEEFWNAEETMDEGESTSDDDSMDDEEGADDEEEINEMN